MKKRVSIGVLLAAVCTLALIASGCGSSKKSTSSTAASGGGVTALPASSCGPVQYEGSGKPQYLIASDLPLIGGSRLQTTQMNKAIAYVLKQQNWKAGKYNIAFQACNDASAQLAKWDPTKCSANAHAYAGDNSLIGVIGTFNSGCAAIEIPVTNQAPGGGLQMISPANTYGCLTEPCSGGEPEKCRREVPSEQGHQERLHPERQGGLRSRRRQELQGSDAGSRHQDRGLLGLRSEVAELPGALHQDQGDEPRRRLHRWPDRREQRPADQ